MKAQELYEITNRATQVAKACVTTGITEGETEAVVKNWLMLTASSRGISDDFAAIAQEAVRRVN